MNLRNTLIVIFFLLASLLNAQMITGITYQYGRSNLLTKGQIDFNPKYKDGGSLVIEYDFADQFQLQPSFAISFDEKGASSPLSFNGDVEGSVLSDISLYYWNMSLSNKFNLITKNTYVYPGLYLGILDKANQNDNGYMNNGADSYIVDNFYNIKKDFISDYGFSVGIEHHITINQWFFIPIGIIYSQSMIDVNKNPVKMFNQKVSLYTGIMISSPK